MKLRAQIRSLIVLAFFIGGLDFLYASSIDQGIGFYKEGKYEEAVRSFNSLLVEGPSRSERRVIYLYMGKSYESQGRLDKAIAAYEEAVIYDKKNWRRHRDLGGLYEKSDLPWKALGCYKKANKLNPKETSLFLSLGRCWRKLGLYSDALPWLEKGLAAGDGGPLIQAEFSALFEGQGRFAEAALAASKSDDQGTRLIYLAILGNSPDLIKEGRARLARSGVSKETRQAYENLVQLAQLSPDEILAGKTSHSALQAILESPFIEGKK